jgi:hypothetical protein
VAKVGTSIPDCTISIKRLQCVVEKSNKYSHLRLDDMESNNVDRCTFRIKLQDFKLRHQNVALTSLEDTNFKN